MKKKSHLILFSGEYQMTHYNNLYAKVLLCFLIQWKLKKKLFSCQETWPETITLGFKSYYYKASSICVQNWPYLTEKTVTNCQMVITQEGFATLTSRTPSPTTECANKPATKFGPVCSHISLVLKTHYICERLLIKPVFCLQTILIKTHA